MRLTYSSTDPILQPRVELLLLADGRDRIAFVVVRRIDERLLRQLEKLAEDRVVLRACIAILKIRAAGATDEQRIASKHTVAHEKRVRIVGVPRRVKHIEAQPLDLYAVAFRHPHGDDVGVRLLAHHRDAMGAVAKRTQSGDMVGVQMRIDGLDQLEIELAHELQIAVDLLQHRIDDQRLAAMPTRER